jgi:hypothetical protein
MTIPEIAALVSPLVTLGGIGFVVGKFKTTLNGTVEVVHCIQKSVGEIRERVARIEGVLEDR